MFLVGNLADPYVPMLVRAESDTNFNVRLTFREKSFCTGDEARATLSMIIDGMSKWKTGVPYWAREPKGLDGQGVALQFPLTCSKIHSFCNIADWHYGGSFEGKGSGCNYMCSIILANLHEVQRQKGQIPRHLKIQMDNCAKDNKNHTVLGLLALLVQDGVVEDVEVRRSCNCRLDQCAS